MSNEFLDYSKFFHEEFSKSKKNNSRITFEGIRMNFYSLIIFKN